MNKTAKRCLAILSVCAYLFSAATCAADGGGFTYGGAMDDAGAAGSAATSAETGETEETSEQNSAQEVQRPAGLITAGAWNDNDNYGYWHTLFAQGAETGAQGKFYGYTSTGKNWGFTSLNRVKVTVKDGENAVAGAKVVAKDDNGNVTFRAVADANGVAYLFPNEGTGALEITSGEGSVLSQFTAESRDITVDLALHAEKQNVVDLMFVVDVTGSMGDELSYLNTELADVVNRVALADSETQINLALLFYRDTSDERLFQYYDFEDVTTEEGLSKQQLALSKERASGGGDYPEAVDLALQEAVNKQWNTSATTKIIFHVLDAPPHSGSSYQNTYFSAVETAAEKGIRFCPVLCSGADTLTEYLMRQTAIYTGGTFVFITDDSGIGNAHHDPNLPNVTVEALNSLMVRLINGYHSGSFADPIDWRQDTQK